MLRVLRIVAVVGLLLRLALAIVEDVRGGDPVDFLGALVAIGGATVVLALLLRPEAARIRGALDLLVPAALALCAERVLTWAGEAAAFLSDGTSFPVGRIVVGVSGIFLASILLWAVSAAWTTLLVLDAAAGRPIDLVGALRRVPSALVATIVVCLVGHGGLLAALGIVFFPLLAAAGMQGLVGFAFLLGLPAVAWNVATAGLLVTTLAAPSPRRRALADGVAAAGARWRRWIVPVLGQLVVLGLVTVATGTVHVTTQETRGNKHTTTSTTRTNSKVGVNAFWAGAYEEGSRWVTVFAAVSEREPAASASLLSRLACLMLAIAVRLRIASTLPARPLDAPSPRGPRDRFPRRPRPTGPGAET